MYIAHTCMQCTYCTKGTLHCIGEKEWGEKKREKERKALFLNRLLPPPPPSLPALLISRVLTACFRGKKKKKELKGGEWFGGSSSPSLPFLHDVGSCHRRRERRKQEGKDNLSSLLFSDAALLCRIINVLRLTSLVHGAPLNKEEECKAACDLRGKKVCLPLFHFSQFLNLHFLISKNEKGFFPRS